MEILLSTVVIALLFLLMGFLAKLNYDKGKFGWCGFWIGGIWFNLVDVIIDLLKLI